MNGKIIVLEGLDGCGKSTQFELLKEKYSDCRFITFPNYNSPSGEIITTAGRWKRISKPSMPPSSIRWARAALRSAYPARPSIRSAISLPPRPV